MICPSDATLKSYPGASACTGKTVEALCHFKCNAAIDSIGLILNAMMSSSESWLNRFAIDCVYSVCVLAIFLCCLCALCVIHFVWGRFCFSRTRDFNLLVNIAFIQVVCCRFPFFRPVFSQCRHRWNEQQLFCTGCSMITTYRPVHLGCDNKSGTCKCAMWVFVNYKFYQFRYFSFNSNNFYH